MVRQPQYLMAVTDRIAPETDELVPGGVRNRVNADQLSGEALIVRSVPEADIWGGEGSSNRKAVFNDETQVATALAALRSELEGFST